MIISIPWPAAFYRPLCWKNKAPHLDCKDLQPSAVLILSSKLSSGLFSHHIHLPFSNQIFEIDSIFFPRITFALLSSLTPFRDGYHSETLSLSWIGLASPTWEFQRYHLSPCSTGNSLCHPLSYSCHLSCVSSQYNLRKKSRIHFYIPHSVSPRWDSYS